MWKKIYEMDEIKSIFQSFNFENGLIYMLTAFFLNTF